MTHVKARSGWIREHIKHIEFLFCFVFSHLIGFIGNPFLLPFLFDFAEIIFHFICDYLSIDADIGAQCLQFAKLRKISDKVMSCSENLDFSSEVKELED